MNDLELQAILRQAGEPKLIVLFDGVCELCDHSVQFILRRDKYDRFHFAPLQSEIGEALLHFYGCPFQLDTIVLIENGRTLTRSSAALRGLFHLGGFYRLLYVLIVVPRFIRDAVYRFFSYFRYRLFGKKEHCMMPLPAFKSKFLNSISLQDTNYKKTKI